MAGDDQLQNASGARQEQKDSNCGPTSVLFLRWGGGLSSGAITEANHPVKPHHVINLDMTMRHIDITYNNPKVSNPNFDINEGLVPEQEVALWRTWARVGQGLARAGPRQIFEGHLDTLSAGTQEAQVLATITKLLKVDPRGCMTACGLGPGASFRHAIVVTSLGSDKYANVYNPAPAGQSRTWSQSQGLILLENGLHQLSQDRLFAVLQNYAQQGSNGFVFISGGKAFADKVLINKGDQLGTVMQTTKSGEKKPAPLIAMQDADYYANYIDADRAAAGAGGLAAVVEQWQGVFAVTPLKPLDPAPSPGRNPFVGVKQQPLSTRVYIATGSSGFAPQDAVTFHDQTNSFREQSYYVNTFRPYGDDVNDATCVGKGIWEFFQKDETGTIAADLKRAITANDAAVQGP